jgi:hypothetical protein
MVYQVAISKTPLPKLYICGCLVNICDEIVLNIKIRLVL